MVDAATGTGQRVWRLTAHHADPDAAASWQREHGKVAIGWGDVGDLFAGEFESPGQIGAAIREAYPHLRNSGTGGPSLWAFAHELREGDLLIVKAGGKYVHVARVAGPYTWSRKGVVSGDDYYHQRTVEITDLDPEALWQHAGAGFATGQSAQWTLALCAAYG